MDAGGACTTGAGFGAGIVGAAWVTGAVAGCVFADGLAAGIGATSFFPPFAFAAGGGDSGGGTDLLTTGAGGGDVIG
jgi:hypothetical protein